MEHEKVVTHEFSDGSFRRDELRNLVSNAKWFNLYEVRINGKLQGRVRANFEGKVLTHFSVEGYNGSFALQQDAVLEAIRLNGRKVPKDAKVKYKRS